MDAFCWRRLLLAQQGRMFTSCDQVAPDENEFVIVPLRVVPRGTSKGARFGRCPNPFYLFLSFLLTDFVTSFLVR